MIEDPEVRAEGRVCEVDSDYTALGEKATSDINHNGGVYGTI